MNIHNNVLFICNMALGMLGVAPIVSLQDNTKESSLCSFWYFFSKQEVLSQYPFKFSIRKVILNPVLRNFVEGIDYKYKYVLPHLCVEVISANEGNEYFRDKKYIYCNFSPLNLKYICNIDDDMLPNNIFKLLAYKLASNIALSLNGTLSLVEYLTQSYDTELKKISNLDAQKGNTKGVIEDNTQSDFWINSRRF